MKQFVAYLQSLRRSSRGAAGWGSTRSALQSPPTSPAESGSRCAEVDERESVKGADALSRRPQAA